MLPSWILILAVAPLPFPVKVIRFTPLNVNEPFPGVYPIPALLTVSVPVADPAVPTKLPVAFVPSWENVLPIA